MAGNEQGGAEWRKLAYLCRGRAEKYQKVHGVRRWGLLGRGLEVDSPRSKACTAFKKIYTVVENLGRHQGGTRSLNLRPGVNVKEGDLPDRINGRTLALTAGSGRRVVWVNTQRKPGS